MFQSAVIKLTLWYLLIIMLISLCFSFALFSVTTNDIQQNLRRQGEQFMRFGIAPDDFERARQKALSDLEHREVLNLIRFNLVVLVLAGGAGYFLARRTLAPLELAMESQSRFTGDASHELRTPLTAIRSEIEVALREPKLTAGEATALLESNLEEVKKIENLTYALLQLARFGERASEIDMTELDLTEPLKAAVSRIEKAATARSMTIAVTLKHIQLRGNAASLTELFATLLDNAVKYGKDNGHIDVVMTANSKEAIVVIKDDGIGIAPADLPRIFDRFYRAESSRSKSITDGYGLGLALAQQVITAHQGSLVADSVLGSGSIFTIRMPLETHVTLPGVARIWDKIRKPIA